MFQSADVGLTREDTEGARASPRSRGGCGRRVGAEVVDIEEQNVKDPSLFSFASWSTTTAT